MEQSKKTETFQVELLNDTASNGYDIIQERHHIFQQGVDQGRSELIEEIKSKCMDIASNSNGEDLMLDVWSLLTGLK